MDQRIAANSRAAIFAGLRSLGTAEVARLLNCSESTVSELSAEGKYKLNFTTIPDLLARMDLKIVPAGNKCMDPKKLDSILELARAYMAQVEAKDLWDDSNG